MRCPICKKEVPAGEPFAPFCSDRCRLIDLGKWASGEYVIPARSLLEEDQDSPERDVDDQ